MSTGCEFLGGEVKASLAIQLGTDLDEDNQVENQKDSEGGVAEDGVRGESCEGNEEAFEEV